MIREGDLEAKRDGTGELTIEQRAVLECAIRELQEQLSRRSDRRALSAIVVASVIAQAAITIAVVAFS